MDKIEFKDWDVKHLYDFGDGRKFTQYANLDKLENAMIEVAPEDREVIREFIGDTRKFQSVQMSYDKPREFLNLPGKLKMIKALPQLIVIKKWINISAQDFSKRFKSQLLRDVVSHFSSPVLFEMFVLSEMDLKRCGYPVMGSLEFSKLFEKKYLSCGGKINYNSIVSKIVVEKDRACGIVLQNGEKYAADLVISAADGKTVVYDMLGGKYIDKTIENEYRKGDLNPSKIQVSLGVNHKFEGFPHNVKIILPSPLTIGDGSRYEALDVMLYNEVKGISPENRTLTVLQLDTKNGDYWTELKKLDREKYRLEKDNIANIIIDILDERLGCVRDNIDMTDVATPATYVRYTGNWKGSIQGWANENIFKSNPFKKELPGLKNFYMIGQWVEPGGGVPTAFKSGRDIAQIICKRDNVKFAVC